MESAARHEKQRIGRGRVKEIDPASAVGRKIDAILVVQEVRFGRAAVREGDSEFVTARLDHQPRIVERRMPLAAQGTDFLVFVIVEEVKRSEHGRKRQQNAGAYPKHLFHDRMS